MALTDLQKAILAVVAANRSPDSRAAGGAVIQAEGPRLSHDLDFFQPDALLTAQHAAADRAALTAAGFRVRVLSPQGSRMIEVAVERGGEETEIQWVPDTIQLFLRPIQDPQFGWRLQMPDLAVGKLIAAATRGEPRDFIDLVFIDQHYTPLWVLAWAAPGKDPAFSPQALLDRVERLSYVAAPQFSSVLGLEPFSPQEVRRLLVDAVEEARAIVDTLPKEDVGHLYVHNGVPILRPDPVAAVSGAYERIGTSAGGAWPVLPGVISDSIRSLASKDRVHAVPPSRGDTLASLLPYLERVGPDEGRRLDALRRVAAMVAGRPAVAFVTSREMEHWRNVVRVHDAARQALDEARKGIGHRLRNAYRTPDEAESCLRALVETEGADLAARLVEGNPGKLGELQGGIMIGRAARKTARVYFETLPQAIRDFGTAAVNLKSARQQRDELFERVGEGPDRVDAMQIDTALQPFEGGMARRRASTTLADRLREVIRALEVRTSLRAASKTAEVPKSPSPPKPTTKGNDIDPEPYPPKPRV